MADLDKKNYNLKQKKEPVYATVERATIHIIDLNEQTKGDTVFKDSNANAKKLMYGLLKYMISEAITAKDYKVRLSSNEDLIIKIDGGISERVSNKIIGHALNTVKMLKPDIEKFLEDNVKNTEDKKAFELPPSLAEKAKPIVAEMQKTEEYKRFVSSSNRSEEQAPPVPPKSRELQQDLKITTEIKPVPPLKSSSPSKGKQTTAPASKPSPKVEQKPPQVQKREEIQLTPHVQKKILVNTDNKKQAPAPKVKQKPIQLQKKPVLPPKPPILPKKETASVSKPLSKMVEKPLIPPRSSSLPKKEEETLSPKPSSLSKEKKQQSMESLKLLISIFAKIINWFKKVPTVPPKGYQQKNIKKTEKENGSQSQLNSGNHAQKVISQRENEEHKKGGRG